MCVCGCAWVWLCMCVRVCVCVCVCVCVGGGGGGGAAERKELKNTANNKILGFPYSVYLAVTLSPSSVSALRHIFFFSALVNPLRSWTLLSHSFRYPRKSSSSHYVDQIQFVMRPKQLSYDACANLQPCIFRGAVRC